NVEATIAQHPLLARELVEMFDARFNPAIDDAPTRWKDNQPQRRVQLTALPHGYTAFLKALEPMLEASFSDRYVYRET
ncbi:NAD-glutamate dehydrogenase, partial [Xylella fastidiosa subsp. multiplex]|nr:NAD-glutamate dehydrogenase [Xylella fastidiosa subsp. multiplex]